MENTKAKIILIVVLILLLLGCLSFVIWQHVQIKQLSSKYLENEKDVNTPVIDVNKGNEEQEIELEDVKSEYSYIVEHAINKKQPRVAWSECANEYLHINVVAPKININTENVSLVNQEIVDKYSNMSVDTAKGGYNIEVNYTYKHVPSRDLLFVLITERYQALCATGSVRYQTYIYNTKKDEFLNLEQLLELYNITKSDLIDSANDKLIEHITGGTFMDIDEQELQNYKNRVVDVVNNNEIEVLDLDDERLEIYFPVDIEGLKINI